ncbi:predicted protein [Plenodomus lingam JN3]|uniref:Predicted protein n=1 Tax=Leptosphaeria maculans (strain JN3 / isolate v23.1.3 / race Av1-4-5-6-7-8) TaxID=985895 RepID=E4ZW55_LEPMJ|nr:predicted protein [Plenodomus lingam JN3]CBX95831.1 predicted protein [Plenodomus lingam JN3]
MPRYAMFTLKGVIKYLLPMSLKRLAAYQSMIFSA